MWRFADRNQNGSYNDAGEITVFYDDVQGGIALPYRSFWLEGRMIWRRNDI